MMRWLAAASALLVGFAAPAPAQTGADFRLRPADAPQPYVAVKHPAWTRDAVIYQINTRQFTQAGTFAAAAAHLPRLKRLGVDILWLMPIHPIGVAERKGRLGSPYAVRDYFGVNPEFGTVDDLRRFVDAAHGQGMHVILDWVANHSARDNPLVTQHPDWYERDWRGEVRPTPWFDWSDIIDFDYSKPALRRYMTEAMKFWVREAGVDGFRADFAGGVPLQFWENARAELDAIKPVFMLAEWEYPEFHRRAFDASYAWKLTEAMHAVAKGTSKAARFAEYFSWHESAWPRQAYKLAYTSNHDTNAWEGTDREVYGPALPAMTALTFAADTMPLIYNGQEAGLDKRLAFFDRDPIVWRDHPGAAFYARLIAWKKANPALANGEHGGRMVKVETDGGPDVLAFVREVAGNKVLSVFNFSGAAKTVTFADALPKGSYADFEGGRSSRVDRGTRLALPAWGFRLMATNVSKAR